ncbi:MAG: hypothetical protein AB8F78_03320 [Saprospiraceae bacterium]
MKIQFIKPVLVGFVMLLTMGFSNAQVGMTSIDPEVQISGFDDAESSSSYLPPRSGKMRTRPYWLWYAAGGIGYEVLSAQSGAVEEAMRTRTPFLRSSFTGGIMRAFGERFGASFNLDYGRRQDRYTLSVSTATSGGSLVKTSKAHFSDLSTLLTVNYLVPTRGCDFQVYAGVGYSILQNWTGKRIYGEDANREALYNTESPYSTNDISNRLRYTIGTRAAKSVNEFLYLVFDSQLLLQSEYDVSDAGILGSEIGNSVNIRLGVGYRLEKGSRR